MRYLFLLLLPFTALGQISDAALTTQVNTEIRAKTYAPYRAGNMYQAIIDSKASIVASYANPTWITSLAWTKLSGVPTTLSGFGITDGVVSSRTISTTSPLAGGGDLSANRTLSINTAGITYSLIQNVTALSVFGRASNTTGVGADITAASDGNILYRNGTSLTFGSPPGTSIANTPAGNIGSTTVQAALNELDAEKASILGAFTASGTNTYTVTVPGITALTSGQSFDVKFTNGNTTAATLNPNGLGAVALVKNVTSPLVTGDIIAGGSYRVTYDGTNFQLMHNFNVGLGASGNFVYTNNLQIQAPSLKLSPSAGTADVTSPILAGSGSAATFTTRYSNAADLIGFLFTNNGSSTFGAHNYKIVEISTDAQPFNISTGTATFKGLEINASYNMTGGTSTITDLHINTGEISMTGTTHYGVLNGSTTARNGFATSTPVSTLETGQSFAAAITSTSTDLTLTIAHYTVLVDASGAARTITLPAAATCTRRIYVIKKIDSSGNNVVIDGDGAETIDGATTQTVSTQWTGWQIQSNGTSWFITSTF